MHRTSTFTDQPEVYTTSSPVSQIMPHRNLARLVAEHSSLCNRESYRDIQSGDSQNQDGHHAWSTDANHEFCGFQKDCKKRTAVVRSGQLRIHTFWARSLWFNASGIVDYEVREPLIPENIYLRLIPVLELASAMLDLSDEFMARSLCAPTLTKHDKRTGKDHLSLDPEYEVTEADRMKYKQFLCQLPDYQRVYFRHSASHFGSEGPFRDASCLYVAPSEEGPFIISYKISGSFIDFYTHTDWMKFSEEQIRLVNFQLVLVLVHEFAHGVGFARVGIPMFAHKMDSDKFRDQETEFLFHPDHYHE